MLLLPWAFSLFFFLPFPFSFYLFPLRYTVCHLEYHQVMEFIILFFFFLFLFSITDVRWDTFILWLSFSAR